MSQMAEEEGEEGGVDEAAEKPEGHEDGEEQENEAKDKAGQEEDESLWEILVGCDKFQKINFFMIF